MDVSFDRAGIREKILISVLPPVRRNDNSITAYSMTFASFMLFAGRLADLFPAQWLFEGGLAGLGILMLILSFGEFVVRARGRHGTNGEDWISVTNKYGFLVIRALQGICGALTIPSA